MIMTVFYEIVIPRARNVKGIEQSNVAAYNAESGIEASLNSFTGSKPVANVDTGSIGIYSVSGSVEYNCPTNCTFPESWKGNSPTDPNYNIIRPQAPIQIPISDSTITSGFSIIFHMPDAFSGGIIWEQLKGNTTDPYFIWTFTTPTRSITSWQGEKLNFSLSKKDFTIYNNTSSTWITNSWTSLTLWDFINSATNMTSECTPNNYKCILKISLIKDLETTAGKKIPYLEYQITTSVWNALKIPLQYATLTSTGTQGPFSKTVTREVERFTTNEAFDFTVLQ
jgi:hypothetical protein